MPIALIESLDREGRGVAHVGGKAVFVDNAVPGERVEYSAYRKKPAWEAAQIVRIEQEGAARISPRCAFSRTRSGTSGAFAPRRCCGFSTGLPGDTGTGRACRCAGLRRRAGPWS